MASRAQEWFTAMQAFAASSGPEEDWTAAQRAESERLQEQPLRAEIDALEAVSLEFFNSDLGNGDEWLECLLVMATRHAQRMGRSDLLHVLNALAMAHGKNELGKLLTRESNTTMVGHADAYLEKASVVGGARVNWVKRIAQAFHPEPDESAIEHRAKVVCRWLHTSGAELALGPPGEDEPLWPIRVMNECVKVRTMKDPADRRPDHYARAVLRGWGMTAAEADDAVVPVERDALK